MAVAIWDVKFGRKEIQGIFKDLLPTSLLLNANDLHPYLVQEETKMHSLSKLSPGHLCTAPKSQSLHLSPMS
jgi:hypothetical protein